MAAHIRKELLRVRAKRLIGLTGIILITTGASVMASQQADLFSKAASAKPMALGGAYVTLADKADAVYWNSAGLTRLKGFSAVTTHSSLSEFDMTTDAVSLALPGIVEKSGFGIGVYRSSIDDIMLVGTATSYGATIPVLNGTFAETEDSVVISYGQKISKKFAVGITGKYQKIEMLDYSEDAIGADVGFIYDIDGKFSFGANLQNVIEPEFGTDTVEFNAKIGASYRNAAFLIAADYDTNILGEGVYHAGAQYLIIPELAARIGTNDGKLTAGVGISGIKSFTVDYAYEDTDIGDAHKISVSFDTKKKGGRKKSTEPSPKKVETPKLAPKPEPQKVADTPKPAPTPEPQKVVEAPKPAPKPAPAKPIFTSVIDSYTFLEADGSIRISNTDLQEGQIVTVIKKQQNIADVEITSAGFFASRAKILKMYAKDFDGYMIGDQLGVK